MIVSLYSNYTSALKNDNSNKNYGTWNGDWPFYGSFFIVAKQNINKKWRFNT